MHRINFIHQPRSDSDPVRSFSAFVASCLFHGLLVASFVGLSLFYRSQLPPIKSGSAPGAPVMMLETMVITPPPQPTPPVKSPPVPEKPPTLSPPKPRQLVVLPKLPDEGVPVLAAQPARPAPATPAKTHPVNHPAISPTATTMTITHPKAAAPSSYAPGPNFMPHPPYPIEAQDRQEAGTVYLDVQFDAQGGVVGAKVTQSSGVPILDSETKSFIRTYWHCPEFAGQNLNVPVLYQLQ